jgi:hypothetical protein
MTEQQGPASSIVSGTKLYPAKGRNYLFLALYAILAAAGSVIIAQSLSRNENPSGTSGFMVIFGVGMFILILLKSRKPQVSLYEEYLELNQSRKPIYIYYKKIVSVSRPDKNRLVVKLWEEGVRKDVTIWLKELDKADIERLEAALSEKSRKAK